MLGEAKFPRNCVALFFIPVRGRAPTRQSKGGRGEQGADKVGHYVPVLDEEATRGARNTSQTTEGSLYSAIVESVVQK